MKELFIGIAPPELQRYAQLAREYSEKLRLNSLQNYLSFSLQILLMEFRGLSDEEWELIKPLLSPKAKTGRPRADDRRVLNSILYVLTTGCRWMDMPPKYGHYSTAFRRLKHWQTQGIWTRILKTLNPLNTFDPHHACFLANSVLPLTRA